VDQIVDSAPGNTVDVGFLYHCRPCLFRRPARLQKRADLTALARLRNVPADRARAGIPLPRPIAVTLVLAVRAAPAMLGIANGRHLDIHQPRRRIPSRSAQEIRALAFGDHARKVDHAILRCRRSLHNLRL